MSRMQAVYYRDARGVQPVDALLEGLPVRTQVVVDNQIDRLNMLKPDDPPLPFPHSSQVRGQLRELRCHHGNAHYRILYRRSEQFFVLLHAFRKSSGAIPDSGVSRPSASVTNIAKVASAVGRLSD
jgi:phage-related protein